VGSRQDTGQRTHKGELLAQNPEGHGGRRDTAGGANRQAAIYAPAGRHSGWGTGVRFVCRVCVCAGVEGGGGGGGGGGGCVPCSGAGPSHCPLFPTSNRPTQQY
jgi:hypothetical protein